MAYDFPVVIGSSGLQPQDPSSLRTQLLNNVAATNPGYTANLPASLIEDVSSTDVGAIALCDQAKVELVNSLTPYGANEFLLLQQGQMLGLRMGQTTNTSVVVQFSGTVGYVVPNGELIGDGTNAYVVQTGGVIGSNGTSASLTAIAVNASTPVPAAGAVTQILSSVPSGITLTVTNAQAGTPAGTPETFQSYRARVLQAMLAACVGGPRLIKTLIGGVTGVSSRLISVQQASSGLRICLSGGDVYQVAYAIFSAVGDVATLQGSGVSSSRNVTVSLNDYPDTYNILFVNAPQQSVTLSVTWNTTLSNFTGGAAFPSLTQQPLADYINSVPLGQPLNVMEMNRVFQDAVAALLDPALLTRLVIDVYIGGVLTNPTSGTYAIPGDTESYFYAVPTGITVTQG